MSKIIIRLIAIVFTIIMINTPIAVNADTVDSNEKIYKVGFYDYNPYFFINDKGRPDGYYHDILEMLSKDLNIKYEYVMLEIKECIEMLETGEIDILLGLNRSAEREDKFIYTDHYIAVEKYGIYTNKNIKFGHLEELENIKFGIIEKEANSEWIINFFSKNNINIEPVIANTYEGMTELLLSGKVDAISSTITNEDIFSYNKIYEYSAGPVYIATSKNNVDLANKINKWLVVHTGGNNKQLSIIQNKYFGQIVDTKVISQIKIMLIVLVLLIALIIYFKIYPVVKKKLIQNKIRTRIKLNQYIIQYQPIIDPKKDVIIGFEGLIRYNDLEKGVLGPYHFINEIEENEMMSELSIWILNKIVEDYNNIKLLNKNICKDFYISMNITSKIMENKEFVHKVREILDNSDVKETNICMEIVETFKINNLPKVKESIKEFKELGVKIAIDDFGVEHSNLDVIEKIDFDIMKLDKYFIDDIECSMIRREIVSFLSNIGKVKNSCVIAEGVENEGQKEIIKNIDNNRFYIQGFYYSKPVNIEDIQNIII